MAGSTPILLQGSILDYQFSLIAGPRPMIRIKGPSYDKSFSPGQIVSFASTGIGGSVGPYVLTAGTDTADRLTVGPGPGTPQSPGVIAVLGGGDDTVTVNANSLAVIDGGTGFDTVTIRSSGPFSKRFLSDGTFNLDNVLASTGAGVQVYLRNVERVTFGGVAHDLLVAGSSNAAGSATDDYAFASATARGALAGGAGIDEFYLGSRAYVDLSKQRYSVDQGRTWYGLTGFEIVHGSDAADTLVGSSGADALEGGGGNDYLVGGAGADTVDGGDGDDSVSGGAGNDQLYGGQGDDTIDGGSGSNQLFGGAGNDVLQGSVGNGTFDGGLGQDDLFGGAGDDVFVFRLSDSGLADMGGGTPGLADQIHDFSVGDKIDLTLIRTGVKPLTFTGTAAQKGVNSVWYEVITGGPGGAIGSVVHVDFNGDGKRDMDVFLWDVTSMTARDFTLR